MELRGGCTNSELTAAALAYRGDGRYKSDRRIESAFLRVWAADLNKRDALDDPDFDFDSIFEEAEPDTIEDVTVRGRPGKALSIRSGVDPGPVSWPALAWTEGDLVFWITGEGLDESAVRLVAESLRSAEPDVFDALVDGERCGE